MIWIVTGDATTTHHLMDDRYQRILNTNMLARAVCGRQFKGIKDAIHLAPGLDAIENLCHPCERWAGHRGYLPKVKEPPKGRLIRPKGWRTLPKGDLS